MGDDQIWTAYFDADKITRRGYDFPKGTVLRVSMPYDARAPDNQLHSMVRILKSMRSRMGVAPLLELRGEPNVVQMMVNEYEFMLNKAGFKVIDMPKGFTVGWG